MESMGVEMGFGGHSQGLQVFDMWQLFQSRTQ